MKFILQSIWAIILIRLFLPLIVLLGILIAALSAVLGMYVINMFTDDPDFEMGGAAVGMFAGLWLIGTMYEKLKFKRMEKQLEKLERD